MPLRRRQIVQSSGEPAVQLYCHCDDCQSAHSARLRRFGHLSRRARSRSSQGDADEPLLCARRRALRCERLRRRISFPSSRASERAQPQRLSAAQGRVPSRNSMCNAQHAVLPVGRRSPALPRLFPPRSAARRNSSTGEAVAARRVDLADAAALRGCSVLTLGDLLSDAIPDPATRALAQALDNLEAAVERRAAPRLRAVRRRGGIRDDAGRSRPARRWNSTPRSTRSARWPRPIPRRWSGFRAPPG